METLPSWLRGARGGASAVGAAIVLVFGAAWAASSPLAATVSLVGAPIVSAIVVATALSVALRGDLDRGIRTAWGFIAASYVPVLVADALTVTGRVDDDVLGAIYVGTYPFTLAGLLFFPSAPVRPGERTRFLLDLATVFTGATMVVWTWIVAPTVASYPADLAAQVIAAGPLVGDIVLVAGVAIVILRGAAVTTRAALGYVIAGTAAYAAGDMWYASAALAGTYDTGDAVDGVWLAGGVLMAIGAARQAHAGDEADDLWLRAAWDRLGEILPYVGTALGFAILVWLAVDRDDPHLAASLGAVLLCAFTVARQAHLLAENRSLHRQLAVEYKKSEQLLLNVLPEPIAARLKQRPHEPIVESVAEVTVVFADLVGFTPMSATTPPADLLELLNDVFSRFDALAERHGIEKIKTIGDAYMAASGLPVPRPDHATAAAAMALGMVDAIATVNRERKTALTMRIGVHSGPVVAGVIGHKKFIYDLWGDTVNTASRMESHGVAGAVHVSDATRARLGAAFVLEPRGEIEVKGKGAMTTWLLVGRREG